MTEGFLKLNAKTAFSLAILKYIFLDQKMVKKCERVDWHAPSDNGYNESE